MIWPSRLAPFTLALLVGGCLSAAEPLGKYAFMDHGPFFSGTVVQPDNICTNKGIIITVDQEHKVLAVFDQELLRFSYGAIDASIVYPPGRDGIEGQPGVEGSIVFTASGSTTGWAKPGSVNFADPRSQHLGNLPREWGDYLGLYLNGNTVVLHYTIGGADVLEVPGFSQQAKVSAITRSLTLSGNAHDLTLLVAEGAKAGVEENIGLIEQGDTMIAVGAVGGILQAAGGRLSMTIPGDTRLAKLAIWHGPKSEVHNILPHLSSFLKPLDARAMTKGGKGRWPGTLVSHGDVGNGSGSYVVDTIRVPFDNPWKSYMRITGHDFFKDGRAAVCTMDGDVWIVSGLDGSFSDIAWKRFATGLFQPLGLRIVDDIVYLTCRDRLMRLKNVNKDGEADYYESFNSDCPVTKAYHEFAMDLETDKEGNFYYAKGSNLGGASDEMQGCILKVSKDGSALSRYCTGLREPNGMGGGDGYPLLNSDNQGNWMPVDRINLVKQGGFYGFMGTAHREPAPSIYDPPICWTPYNLDNSPGGLAYVPNPNWGPFKDMPVGLSYGKSCMFIVLMEQVDNVPQGGIVFFPLNFASGIMRARFNPHDGQLYVSGMRGWQTNAAQEGAFQRVRYTGKPVYMPNSLHIHPGAVEIGFDQELDGTATDPRNYSIDQWNYRWTGDYGSDDYSVANPSKKGHDPVEIAGITMGKNRKSVFIKINGLAPVMQMRIQIKISAAEGGTIHCDVYNTINKIPVK